MSGRGGGDNGPDPFIGFANGQLRFDALLGRGAMGAVYRGRQLGLDREVAIKIIAPHLADDQLYLERFRREAQALGRQIHPHIITCHDVGPCAGPNGRTVIAMVLEFIDGASLGTLLRGGKLTVRTVLDLHAQAARGLAAAHRIGIIHRDVKPDNIMVTRSGRAKLADFGLARADDTAAVTTSGTMLGSPAYMSPEACRGERVGAKGDLYSLGCSLFHALTGKPPYETTNSFAAIRHHTTSPVPELRERRPDLVGLDPLLKRLLAKAEDDRPADAASVADELEALAGALPADLVAGRLDPAAHADIPLARTLVEDPAPAGAAPATPLRRGGRGRAASAETPAWRLARARRARWRRDLAFIAVIACGLIGGGAILTLRGRHGAPPAAVADPPRAAGLDEAHALALQAALAEIEGLIAEKRLQEAAQALAAQAVPAGLAADQLPTSLKELAQRLAHVQKELASAGFAPGTAVTPPAPAGPRLAPATIPPEPLAAPAVQLVPGVDIDGWLAPAGFPGLPDRLPGGGGGVVFSTAADAGPGAGWEREGRQVLTLRVPGGQHGGHLLLMISGQASKRPLDLTALMGNERRPLPRTVLDKGGWQPLVIDLGASAPTAQAVELVAPADMRLALARAVWTPEGQPAPTTAAARIIPGTLLRIGGDAGPLSFGLAATLEPWQREPTATRGRKRMLALPTGDDRFAARAAPALARALPGMSLPLVRYAAGGALDTAFAAARAADRDLLYIYLPTGSAPQFQTGFATQCRDLALAGLVPVIILGPEAWQGAAGESWDQLLRVLAHKVAGLPVIDLRQVPLFQARNQLPADLQEAGTQALVEAGLVAGAQELQARLDWQLQDHLGGGVEGGLLGN